MSAAFKCDVCGEFHTGTPSLTKYKESEVRTGSVYRASRNFRFVIMAKAPDATFPYTDVCSLCLESLMFEALKLQQGAVK